MSKDVIHEIQFDNVSYDYMSEKPVRAVDNVSLEINKGEFICVIGHNGSGKSTLAKHINALFTPTLGKVLVCGMDSSEENDTWLIRSKAGMVFQNPDNQIVSTTVEEDVAFGLENLGVPQEEMAERIEAALEAVGMSDRIKSEPHMLSGGQKQRVAIAGIIAMRPEIIVMDEPTAMLDPRGRQEVLTTVHILNKEFGITIVLITHFMEEAMNADRVIVMDKGRIMLDGTPAEVFSHIDELHEVGLDIPPPARLANYLKKHGIDLPNLLSVDEMVDELCRLF